VQDNFGQLKGHVTGLKKLKIDYMKRQLIFIAVIIAVSPVLYSFCGFYV